MYSLVTGQGNVTAGKNSFDNTIQCYTLQYNTVVNTTLLWLFAGQCIFLKQDCKF